ncbi:unnamed protein product [Menidia menidia]|uniref:(Atlantic silverside) hypothetical protein n=1 Tax=Menidia menidia TaxID=238744 RepID=A0A8S4AFM3_9TELE|nr:unnamed protein product [Menidia menidia]
MGQNRKEPVPHEDLRVLKVLNQKEDRDLQRKLKTLDKQHSYSRRTLQLRRERLVAEERRVMMVKLCQPKATLNIALKEIREHEVAASHFRRSIHTSGGALPSNTPLYPTKGSGPAEHSRSVSAPPTRRNFQSSVSFVQMKNIATIDSISEKEVARRRQKARDDMERRKQLQWETLHKRVAAFIQRLRDKDNMESFDKNT